MQPAGHMKQAEMFPAVFRKAGFRVGQPDSLLPVPIVILPVAGADEKVPVGGVRVSPAAGKRGFPHHFREGRLANLAQGFLHRPEKTRRVCDLDGPPLAAGDDGF